MARARNIKPAFFKNEELAELGAYAMILFEGLWCIADREGKLEDRPKRIKIETVPYFDVDMEELLSSLQASGFILRYEVKGCKYIKIVNFSKHQKPHKNEVASDIPDPITNKAQPRRETGTTKAIATRADSLNTDSLNIDCCSSARTREDQQPPPQEKIIDHYGKSFLQAMSPSQYERIREWTTKLDDDVLCACVDECCDSNVKTFKYLASVVEGNIADSVKTIEDFKKRQANRQTRGSPRQEKQESHEERIARLQKEREGAP